MKKYILFIIITVAGLSACNNPNQKEIGEVEGLLALVSDTEKSLLSVDTSLVFEAKRQMDKDLADFNKIADTISREEAFKLDDIFSGKKRLTSLTTNYKGFMNQIEFSRSQLNNLKQDLQNGLIKKEDFKTHYAAEQSELINLNSQISKAINGLDLTLEKLAKDRPDFLKILEEKRLNKSTNEPTE